MERYPLHAAMSSLSAPSVSQTAAGAPWTDAAVAEYFTAAKQLLAQPEFAAAAEAAKARQPAPAEPAGVWTSGQTTHQAP